MYFWTISRPSWCHFAVSSYFGSSLDHVGANLGYLGAILGLSWGHLRAFLTSSGAQDGLKRAPRQPKRLSWGHPGGFLGPFCTHLGLSWGLRGAILDLSWTILGQSDASLDYMSADVRKYAKTHRKIMISKDERGGPKPILGYLGLSWGLLEAILGPSWTILGPS